MFNHDREFRTRYYSLAREGVVYHVFNAERMYYGEIISRAAMLLRGKHKPTYCRKSTRVQGDIVIIVNADRLTMPSTRLRYKRMRYHTGHPGGLTSKAYSYLMVKKPEYVFFRGVYKHLPTNRQRLKQLQNLYVYCGPEVPYADFLPNVASQVHPRPSDRQEQAN